MSNCEAIEIVRSTICSLFNLEGIGLKKIARGYSSAGRAPALQAGGRRFDPDYLHQKNKPLVVDSQTSEAFVNRRRRHDAMDEQSRKRGCEENGVHVDDGPVAQLARAYD